MSNKKLLEETTIRKFMKLANIAEPLRENFVSAIDERGGREGDLEAKRGNKGGKKTRGRVKHQQDEAGYAPDDDPQMDEIDTGLGEDDMGLDEEGMGLDELELGGEEGPELDISEEDAMAFIRVAKALEQAMGVEVEAEEEEGLEPEEEEDEVEIEEFPEEEEIEVEEEPEEIEVEEEPEEAEEEEIELQEALVKKVAARVAKRLLKKR
jgi:hypothetical protein